MNPSVLLLACLPFSSVMAWPLYPKCSISPLGSVENIFGFYNNDHRRLNRVTASVTFPLPRHLPPGTHQITFFTDLPVSEIKFVSWAGRQQNEASVYSAGIGFNFTLPFTSRRSFHRRSNEIITFEMIWANLFGRPVFTSIYVDGTAACFHGNVIQLEDSS